jgi:dihydrofolate reductase
MTEPLIKCSVYIAASVDGFIARPDGDIEWLHNPAYESNEKLGLTYEEFISTVDTIVMGRNTFEKVLAFGFWPYEGTPVVVLTNRKLTMPEHLQEKVRIEKGSPIEVVSGLASEGKKHLYIDGGKTIQRFLRERLIDEITITRIPILLGNGIPLFDSNGPELHLTHLETTTTGNGFVQTRYRIK